MIPTASYTGSLAVVLIIDDNEATARTFDRALRLERYEVLVALSAEDGLRLVNQKRPHAILVDLNMPFVDGLQFLRELRASEGGTNIPAAIVTGNYAIDDQTVAEARRLGAVVHFKPLWIDDLAGIVADLLANPVSSSADERVHD